MTDERMATIATEQSFFADPAVDRVLAFSMGLATEVWVLRERLRAMERLLVAQGALTPNAIDAYIPDGPEVELLARDRETFVHNLMDGLFGRLASKTL